MKKSGPCLLGYLLYTPTWQFWDSGGVKLESLCNFSIVGCQWTVNCLLGIDLRIRSQNSSSFTTHDSRGSPHFSLSVSVKIIGWETTWTRTGTPCDVRSGHIKKKWELSLAFRASIMYVTWPSIEICPSSGFAASQFFIHVPMESYREGFKCIELKKGLRKNNTTQFSMS